MKRITLPCLTIRRPWIDLILSGAKTIETRTWKTDYRGPILLHAGKTPDPVVHESLGEPYELCPLGAIVGIAELIDIRKYTREDAEKSFLSYHGNDDLYSWMLTSARLIPPIKYTGKQGLFWLSIPGRYIAPISDDAVIYSWCTIHRYSQSGNKIKNVKKPNRR